MAKMPREIGTDDMFAPRERGRFGDNESADNRGRAQHVNGASDLIDLTVWLMMDNPDKKAIAVCDPAKPGKSPWIWIPRSQCEYVKVEPGLISLTLPQWLAKDKGLI
jgi:hypothetical protein